MVTSRWRGHEIQCIDNVWYYWDTGRRVDLDPERECDHCGKQNRKDGHDACLGELPGVMNACCGHGVRQNSYIQFEDGMIVRKWFKGDKDD